MRKSILTLTPIGCDYSPSSCSAAQLKQQLLVNINCCVASTTEKEMEVVADRMHCEHYSS